MEYRKFGSTYILRIDRGEEILASITTLCNAEKIRLGSVSGIGAVGEVTLGVFNREKFAYESTTYTGDYEIASCSGTITTKEGETYLHIHMAVGNAVKVQGRFVRKNNFVGTVADGQQLVLYVIGQNVLALYDTMNFIFLAQFVEHRF